MKHRLLIVAMTIIVVLLGALSLSACDNQGARLVSVQVSRGSLKSTYTVGEAIDLDGAMLTLTYSDGSTQEVALTESMLSGEFNTKTEGSRTLIITYYEQSCKFSYTVIAGSVQSHILSATLTGVKTDYKINEAMSYEGTLSATFDDGTSGEWSLEDIRRSLTVSGFKSDKTGDYTCQLSFDSAYGMITVSYAYTVAPLATITAAAYTFNQPLRVFIDDGRAEFAQALAKYPFSLTYSDGTTAEVYVSDATAVDRSFSAAEISANNTVTVTVTDSYGRNAKVSVAYSVMERFEVHTVTFDPNFENLTPIRVQTDEGTGRVSQQNYNRKGYACLGWFIGSEDGDRFNFNSVVAEDLTLVAKWQIQDYYIKITSFGVPYGSTRYYTVKDTLTLDPPLEQPGYEFLYYTFEGTPLENNTIYAGMYAVNLDLVAVWRPITYNVTYQLHDSAAYPVSNASEFALGTYTTQDTRTLPSPLRDGYTFRGWSTDANGTHIVTSFSGLTGDLTLHANWAAKLYYVTFVQASTDLEIGTKLAFGVNNTEDVVIEAATVDGYRFEGWYTDKACTTEFYQAGGVYILRRGTYTADFTLYAKTTPVYTLYLAREDRDGAIALQFAEGEDADADYIAAWQAAGERNNCLLDYWAYAGDEELPAIEVRIVDGEPATVSQSTATLAAYSGKTFTAHWKGYQRTITYFLGYDDIQETATYDTYLGTTLPTPQRNGYYFAGWKRNNLLTGETFEQIGSCAYGTDLAFFAKWTLTQYTVAFHYMIDDSALLTQKLAEVNSTSSYTVDTYTYTVESEEFVFSDVSAKYNTFGGWYTSTEYLPATRKVSLPKGTYGVTDLYAKWTPTTYGVHYYDAGSSTFAGTLDAAQAAGITYRTHTLALLTPTRRGYRFVGWFADRLATEEIATDDIGRYVVDVDAIFTENGDTLPPYDGNLHYVLTVYAKWEAIPYTLTFKDGKAGTITVKTGNNPNTEGSATTMVFSADNVVNLLPAEANGYAFLGWYTDTNYTQQVTTTVGVYENVTIYPKWEKATYTITYGNLTEDEVTALALPTTYQLSGTLDTSSEFNTGLKNKVKRFGYTLVNLFEDEETLGTAVTALGAASPNGTSLPYCKDVVLYAKWNVVTYTVSLKYKSSAGTNLDYVAAEWGAKSKTMTVLDIGEGYQLPAMSGTGYVTQTDWYADTAYTKEVAGGYLTVAKLQAYASGTGLTLYSKFEAQVYTLSYRCNVEGIDLPADTTFTYFDGKALEELGSTAEYKWFGWYTDDAFSTRVQNVNKNKTTNNIMVADDLILWGRMEAFRTITYDLQGANDLTNPTVSFTKADTVTLPTAVYSDKVFAGWYIAGIGNVGVTLTGLDYDVTVTPLFANKGTTAKTYIDYNEGKTAGIVTKFDGTTTCVLPTAFGTANMFAADATLPVTTLAASVFEGKTTTSVTVPAGYTTIGNRAFAGSRISTITLPNTVTTIGKEAFSGCVNLTTATLNGGALVASGYLFAGCTKLATVTLNDCTIAANCYMFDGCTKLATVTINCDAVGAKCLVGATALTTLTVKGNTTLATMFEVSAGTVFYPSTLTTLHVTGSTIGATFGDSIQQLASITSVYMDADTLVDLSSLSTFLSTRTIYVPQALLSDYQAAYPDWTFVKK